MMANLIVTTSLILPPRITSAATTDWNFLNTVG